MLLAIASLIPLLLILVLVHEWGHYFFARRFGAKVLEFGIGFPPRLFGIYTGRTRITLNSYTQFTGIDGLQDIREGQLITVGSRASNDGGLIAVDIGIYDKKSSNDEDERVLWHKGRIRSIGDGYIELADMLYSINAIPLGGFCRIAGESSLTPQGLSGKSYAARITVLAAGAGMNVLLGMAVLTVMLMFPRTEVGGIIVDEVADGSPAMEAGILAGDQILEADGRSLFNRNSMVYAINITNGEPVVLLLERSEVQRSVVVQPEFDGNAWIVGIHIDLRDARIVKGRVPPWEAIPDTFRIMGQMARVTSTTIGSMISQKAAPDFVGPIGIAQLSGEISRDAGFNGWIRFGVFLSFNIAVLNLLPFPMLDGGHIALTVIEWLRKGKRLAPKTVKAIHLTGLAVLVGGVIFISMQDVTRLLEGGSILTGNS